MLVHPGSVLRLCLLAAICFQANASVPLLAVAKCRTTPTIDGVLAPREWDEAASASGLADLQSHELLAVQPRFWVSFDDEALYFAIAVSVPKGVQLIAEHQGRDSAVYADDAVELFLDPGCTKSRYYHLIANSAGALYDAKNRDRVWNGKGVRCRASVAGGRWAIEMAVPFVDLGATAPTEGERWGVNVCLNYRSRGRVVGTWAKVKGSFHDPANFAQLVFTRRGPVTAVRGVETLLSGRGELALKALGTGVASSSLKIWRRDDEAGPVVDMHAPASPTWSLPFDLPKAAGYQGELRVVRSDLPLLVLPFAMSITNLADVKISAFPDERTLEVEVAAGRALVRPEEHSCLVTIAVKGQKPTKTVRLPRLSASGPVTATFKEDEIPGADLTVAAKVLDKRGKAVFEEAHDLSDPLNPWWLNDRTGAEEVILPPYQPVQVEGDTIRPWGRAYRFGPCLMPAAVETAGASLLVSPAALKAVVDGRALTWEGESPRMTNKRPERVTLAGRAQCAAFELTGTAAVEYDGMIRVDLTLRPKREVRVDELTLEIPVKPEHAEYLYHFPGKWRSVANSGKLPAEGFKHGFKPFWWLGDNDRGFCWFCESAENWLPEDRENAVTIDREEGRVVLRLRLIEGEKVASPLKYTFGFEATPCKKPEKTVWDYRISHRGGYGIQSKPATAASASIQYKAMGNIRGDRGTAEMWVAPSLDSDPAEANKKDHTQVPNVTLFWLAVDEKTNCGLFWCGPPQQLRIWSRVDGNVLTTLSVPVKWKKGELHHVAFSWGDELRVYLDGELKANRPYKGLMPKDLEHAVLHVGKGSAPDLVDEIRVSSVPRTPELAKQPYPTDEHTLLLDHLDLDIVKFGTDTTQPAVAKGGPGTLAGTPVSVAAKHGKGVRLRGEARDYSLLDQLADSGVRTLCFHSHWSWMGYPMPPPEREQDLRDLVKACHAKGIQLLLYGSPLTADEAPEWDLYHKYFLISPRKWPYRYREGHVAPACCWQSRYRNLWLARQARLIDEYDIDGYYLDGSEWPLWCKNEHHGCGYRRRDGKIAATCNIFATRDYMKRLYVLCKSRDPDAQVNIHNSTVMVIPTLGWGTSSWGGEQLGSLSWDKGGAVEKREYALDALPIDAFRTEFMGRQWGVPSEFLCYERPYKTPQILSITLLHHVLVRPNMPHLPRLAEIWRLHDRFGMKEATWHPYWSNGNIFKTSADHTRVSAYRHPRNGLLMLVSNLSAKPAEAKVQFDASRLNMAPPALTARDPISAAPVDLLKSQITIEMAPFSYRYVWVK